MEASFAKARPGIVAIVFALAPFVSAQSEMFVDSNVGEAPYTGRWWMPLNSHFSSVPGSLSLLGGGEPGAWQHTAANLTASFSTLGFSQSSLIVTPPFSGAQVFPFAGAAVLSTDYLTLTSAFLDPGTLVPVRFGLRLNGSFLSAVENPPPRWDGAPVPTANGSASVKISDALIVGGTPVSPGLLETKGVDDIIHSVGGSAVSLSLGGSVHPAGIAPPGADPFATTGSVVVAGAATSQTGGFSYAYGMDKVSVAWSGEILASSTAYLPIGTPVAITHAFKSETNATWVGGPGGREVFLSTADFSHTLDLGFSVDQPNVTPLFTSGAHYSSAPHGPASVPEGGASTGLLLGWAVILLIGMRRKWA